MLVQIFFEIQGQRNIYRIVATVAIKLFQENFSKLSEDMRKNLLLELSKKEKAAEIVKKIIKDHSHILPENIRNLGESI